MNKTLLLIAVVVTGVQCSTARKDFDPTECNQQSASERGYIEGKNGHDPDSNYSFRCREDLRTAVRAGYQKGYDKGRVEYKEMLAKMHRDDFFDDEPSAQAPKITYFCKITWKNRGFQASANTMDEARKKTIDQCAETFGRRFCNPLPECSESINEKAYYCSLSVFTENFSSFGRTKLEAQVNLEKACIEKRSSDFFCKNDQMKCRVNR